MSEFVNTIELLGDEAVVDSIIDRSITEFKDNIIEYMGRYAFYGCSQLSKISCPNVTTIAMHSSGNYTESSFCFTNCTSLKEINFPELRRCGNKFVVSLPNVEIINLPKLERIEGDQFIENAGITRLSLPGLIGDIYSTSLRNNAKLELVDLGKATKIGHTALSGCGVLGAVILRNDSVTTLDNTNAFTNTPIASGTGFIYVPGNLLYQYQAATNWSTYAAQFRALEDYTVDGTTTGELDETKI